MPNTRTSQRCYSVRLSWESERHRPVPTNHKEAPDFFLFLIRKDAELAGFYLFSKSVLRKMEYLSDDEGIRGRTDVYMWPPFSNPLRPRSQAAQEWQNRYYVDLEGTDDAACIDHVKRIVGEYSEEKNGPHCESGNSVVESKSL